MSFEIEYLKGDATLPQINGNKVIVHVCNDIGAWGRGFVMAISKRWPQPEKEYRNWFRSKENFELGTVQFIQVEDDLWIGNMIGQHGIKSGIGRVPPIRYNAIETALEKVADFATENGASVHMPRIGCGLAGGTWDKIEPLINQQLIQKNIKTIVYDL
jgi:O-acetyl-ADP-ribose deacetylase (regulator of RNase III)